MRVFRQQNKINIGKLMKKLMIVVALIATMAHADVECFDMGGGLKTCTDDRTGETYDVWTY